MHIKTKISEAFASSFYLN